MTSTFRDLNLSPNAPAVLKLARLTLGLGEIERMTQHPDGRRETDATHTLMLAMFACEYAPAEWDRATLLRLAWAHDLPEVLCGDVSTLGGLTPEQRRDKDLNEETATTVLIDHLLCPVGRAADPHDRALADGHGEIPDTAEFVRVHPPPITRRVQPDPANPEGYYARAVTFLRSTP